MAKSSQSEFQARSWVARSPYERKQCSAHALLSFTAAAECVNAIGLVNFIAQTEREQRKRNASPAQIADTCFVLILLPWLIKASSVFICANVIHNAIGA